MFGTAYLRFFQAAAEHIQPIGNSESPLCINIIYQLFILYIRNISLNITLLSICIKNIIDFINRIIQNVNRKIDYQKR